ncbi:type 1 glutamine amidotransferase [Vibrio salinus]|uniref:type 1 glutamine amidotransferase n=1 Tax=Vibrio salinus TaxID=2899784 RepID=UPI001E2F0FBB|nr:type 1 glutamine amidotransferase [Vibrio salinus]MCE0494882.1 type 1 glutamine amidotransferase [Vibrio salinus]
MRIHFIIHEVFEAPGAYEYWANKNQHTITYSRVYEGDQLPETVENIDFLIVMGGPQNPATTIEECSHFNSKNEQAFIAKAIEKKKAVLGICLGSQLIGEALGAQYDHSPEKEIGKFPIFLTQNGLSHPLFSHFGQTLSVAHWHNDMPGLTRNAVIIAYSDGCPRQIVAYNDLVFGFQCHMEFTKEVVEQLIIHDTPQPGQKFPFVDSPDKLKNYDYDDMNRKLYAFLDKLTIYYQSITK